ncbi:MAG: alanine racemase [Chloroflexi bacterium HGW-Chloroflexi-7]|nr:MAG: alanine racemase [Chloroflexi bacterium HGW-Chloroflexi-7]
MSVWEQIDQPVLLIDEAIARANIERMAERAKERAVTFRPHFKTHQSAQIGEWFREAGVEKITVSSVEMAEYFANHGWKDILIAFSMNPRQTKRINALARRVHLGILIENMDVLPPIYLFGVEPLDVWLKVDVGNGRTGVDWQDKKGLHEICEVVTRIPRLRLTGLLTHSGHSYHAGSPEVVNIIFREGVDRLNQLRDDLEAAGFSGLKVSVGDTPGCSLCEDWSGIDEVRPGNFVLYDAQQANEGSCEIENIAVALACPVVAKHPTRREVVVYGGAIHLSKDYLEVEGIISYGLPALVRNDCWGDPIPYARVDRLSQEHGILWIPGPEFEQIAVGDLVCILPAHSCLTVQSMGDYLSLNGEKIATFNKKAA